MSIGDRSGEDARLRRAIAGDQQAFTAILRENDSMLRSVAARITPDRSTLDDIMQEAYLKAFRSIGRFDPDGPAAVSSWLYRIVTSCAIDEIRRSGRRPVPAEQSVEPGHDAKLGPQHPAFLRGALRRALAELEPDQAAVVALVDGEGMTQVAVAQQLGIGRRAVQDRLTKGRRQMRVALTREGVDLS